MKNIPIERLIESTAVLGSGFYRVELQHIEAMGQGFYRLDFTEKRGNSLSFAVHETDVLLDVDLACDCRMVMRVRRKRVDGRLRAFATGISYQRLA